MSKYYIKMPEKLMEYTRFSSTEKIFISFLEVLTDKGTRSTDKSSSFLAKKIGMSSAYIATMLKKLSDGKIIFIKREFGRRVISLNNKILLELGFITKKKKRGKNVIKWGNL